MQWRKQPKQAGSVQWKPMRLYTEVRLFSKPSSLAVAHRLRQAPQARPPRSTPTERWAARRVEAYIRSRTPSHPSLCLVDAQQLSVPSFALAGSYGNLYCPFPVNGSS